MTHCPHCETEIDEHEANRCLDAWVEFALFPERIESEWHKEYENWNRAHWYSTDIAAAWEGVGRRGVWIIKYVNVDSTNLKPGNWQTFVQFLTENKKTTAYGDTAPLAICRAALKMINGGNNGR